MSQTETETKADIKTWGNVAGERLRSMVERIERLNTEKKALTSDVADIYAEAKSGGFSVPVMRQLVRLRQKEPDTLAEEDSLLDLYRVALGMS